MGGAVLECAVRNAGVARQVHACGQRRARGQLPVVRVPERGDAAGSAKDVGHGRGVCLGAVRGACVGRDVLGWLTVMLQQARPASRADVHRVVLWCGTWRNGRGCEDNDGPPMLVCSDSLEGEQPLC